MTADVELPPPWQCETAMCPDLYTAGQVRACVAHATAAKDAEIEALRAEVDQYKHRAKTHPAITHCDNCGCDWLDNGLNPIGCPYCKQNDWRAAYVIERTARYHECGMEIEQARIHAETDAALMAVSHEN